MKKARLLAGIICAMSCIGGSVLAKAPDWAQKLEKFGFSVVEKKDAFQVRKDKIKLESKKGDTSNGYLFTDILLCDEYNFEDKSKYIMFDIGLNIGVTTISCAQKENIEHIYSFEPFKNTFEQAAKNISFNPHVAEKITIFNYGLSNEDKNLSLYYNKNVTGGMSTVADHFKNQPGTSLQQVQVRKASTVIKELMKKHPGKKVFLKMDCEGSEFDIIPDLEKEGVLNNIDVIIMEWHSEKPDELKKALQRCGFVSFINNCNWGGVQGMLRAVNIEKNAQTMSVS